MPHEKRPREQCAEGSTQLWKCGSCCYQYGDMPPVGLACLRCREVADVFEKLQREQGAEK